MAKKPTYDSTITLTVAALVVIGIVMVFSSSYANALVNFKDGYFYLKKGLMWGALGTFAMYFCARFPYYKWERYANLLFFFSIGLLILVLTPVGTEINGSQRWITIAGQTIMPSEIAKFCAIIYVSTTITRKKDKIKSFVYGVLPYLLIIGMYFSLIYFQPDLSTAFVLGVVIMSIVFVGGMKLTHFIGLALTGLGAISSLIAYIVIKGDSYKARRITAFLDPWADPSASGFQVIQSLLALGSGGLFGRGLGRSVQKHFYLPEPQNDFIFAIIGEELGFIGGTVVLLLFLILIWRGVRIAMNAPDLQSCLLATGIIALITIQVIINIAVATSSMPVTGMPLPFISSGGNALVVFMALTGILLNISKHINPDRR
ncbi:putative lipid II flippase FtsW [Alkaliphilus serpentinus]|uniref:Probable peptidoglycan glycosyltransferase FtsW n=1 Tax=Alkaliphilus serpentinus TaxID=1482731 RepID=A0A833HRI8_9FIRM|nr:putative lipid II flippase FtsW [Alkaliphilus serpentinus]KAB3533194.1 putative lipid II flippase FtsW [Alkaliphilus serpentinus]